jgi:hypothetical protein
MALLVLADCRGKGRSRASLPWAGRTGHELTVRGLPPTSAARWRSGDDIGQAVELSGQLVSFFIERLGKTSARLSKRTNRGRLAHMSARFYKFCPRKYCLYTGCP